MHTDDALHRLLDQLRDTTADRTKQLTGELSALTAARQGSTDDDEHDPEGVTLSSEWSRLHGLLRDAEAELQQIDDALERLTAGTYGVCDVCAAPIPVERLEVRPFARTCVPCATR